MVDLTSIPERGQIVVEGDGTASPNLQNFFDDLKFIVETLDALGGVPGPTGATGAAGAEGPAGPTGAAGADGADGVDGADAMGFIELAEATILREYSDTVSALSAAKSITKFGRYEDLNTTPQTVQWLGGNETYATTDAINTIVSTSASDTGSVRVQGHTLSGGLFTEQLQDVTLNGTTPVSLPVPLARVQRVRYNAATSLVGDVTVYEAGGDDFIQAPAGANQTYKASMTTSDGEYLLITNFMCSVTKRTSAVVDFELQVRNAGQSFRPQLRMSLGSTSQNSGVINLSPYLIVAPNSDVRVVAVSSAVSTSADASFQGIYAT